MIGSLGGLGGSLGGLGGLFGASSGGGGGGGGFLDALGPLMQFVGSERQNYLNREMVEDNQQFQMFAAKHGYRWSMEDMYKAGLNPILAGKYGGSGNLSGSVLPMQNSVGSMAEAVRQFAATNATVKNLAADTLTKVEDAKVKNSQLDINDAMVKEISARIENIRSQTKLNQSSAQSIDYENVAKQIQSDLLRTYPQLKQSDEFTIQRLIKTLIHSISTGPSGHLDKSK